MLTADRLSIPLEPSIRHQLLICASHLLAAVAIVLAGQTFLLTASLLLALACSLLDSLPRARLDVADAVVAFGSRDGEWWIRLHDGRVEPARCVDSVLRAGLVVLVLASESGRRTVPVLRDSTSADNFRRLKVFLKLMGPNAVPNVQPNLGGTRKVSFASGSRPG